MRQNQTWRIEQIDLIGTLMQNYKLDTIHATAKTNQDGDIEYYYPNSELKFRIDWFKDEKKGLTGIMYATLIDDETINVLGQANHSIENTMLEVLRSHKVPIKEFLIDFGNKQIELDDDLNNHTLVL